ncbi:prepilin peptidase [Acinetobacter larvae]|uniref:Prepilin leader peptidase/N-methyltransferase n=1 Tax=Acinetobacter larvae TaxID=1789224 RepID=A0A1B2LVV3_9GAMM|nr:A24 family peptidase [Acinetobacter larvae]AOA57068.1 prepilin peptidase [Acinetobacter larvae]
MQELLIFLASSELACYSSIGLLSLCVGSFLNVVIYRIPLIMQSQWQQEYLAEQQAQHTQHTPAAEADIDTNSQPSPATMSLSLPASHCPQCQHKIRFYHNIPLLSWLLLKGRCADCQQPIPWRYPLVEALTLLCSLWVVHVFAVSSTMLAALLLTWALIALSFIDLDWQLLPDRITLPLAGLGLMCNSFGLLSTAQSAIWGYVFGFLSLWMVYFLFKLFTGKEGMGYGDFKLLAALGAWLGVEQLPLLILLSSMLGAIIGMILLKVRQDNRAFAFGPYLAIAGWITLLYGKDLMHWYWQL